ncbi:CapA family protein [Ammoniphilus sp. YIM 78166]|uniref:CapA family protein n=1 Tax=Ammoniphilus sp. YIM 78166 TaxID=1644106 RepID=UPI00106FB370|nr:CapA family protein [Ammoniphilus sp. YIM 78166]
MIFRLGFLLFFLLTTTFRAEATSAPPILLAKDQPYALIGASTKPIDPPLVKEGRTLVPARFIAEQLGATVGWEETNQSITIVVKGKQISMVVGQPRMQVQEQWVELDVPVQLIKGRTYLPLRALVEVLDWKVTYDRGFIVVSQEGMDQAKLDNLRKQYEAALPPIRILFAGDAMFDGSVKTAVRKHGPDYPFLFVKEEVQKADYAIVNLETAVTNRGEKDSVQKFNFRSDPISLKGVKNAGFDMVSLGNNHALDYGKEGFLDTLKYLKEQDLKFIGAGINLEEAFRAEKVEINGKTIKFMAFSRFLPSTTWYAQKNRPGMASAYQEGPVLEAIKREKKDTDYLLVYIHWGVERDTRPQAWQRSFAKKMIDAGADGIVGAHPHVLQGFEYYKGKPIAYSIGNFVFPDYVKGPTAQTGLLTVQLKKDKVGLEFKPYYIKSNQVTAISKKEQEDLLKYLESISYGVKVEGYEVRPR